MGTRFLLFLRKATGTLALSVILLALEEAGDMKTSILMSVFAVLLAFVFMSCAMSEISWSMKENTPNPLRQIVGLPSVAIGNLNPSARNPGVEILCTGLFDVPGGYCTYFAPGVPFIYFPMASNFTVIENSTRSEK